MSYGPKESVVIEPPHPFEGGKPNILDGAPGAPRANDLRLEEPNDGLGQGVVVAVPRLPTEGSMPASTSRSA